MLSHMTNSCSFTSKNQFSPVYPIKLKIYFENIKYLHSYNFLLFYRALQARVSRQVMMEVDEDDSDDEPKQPERVSLADLKHRGKKKAIAPINRVGPAVKGKNMNIQVKPVAQFLIK